MAGHNQEVLDPNEMLGLEEENQYLYRRIGLLEFDEEHMGQTYRKRDFLFLALGALSLFLFAFVIRIPGLEREGNIACGILLLLTFWYVSGAINNGIVGIICFVLPFIFGIMPLSDLLGQIGGSAVPMLVPMLIFAYSILNTSLGQRITFFMIKKLGKSPVGMVMAFGVATAFLSAFCVNWSVIVIMVPIAIGVLSELGETPGKRSRFGGAIMASILLGSATGGAALVCGSGINPAAIAIMEASTNGEMTVTFVQWAILGVPFALIATPICVKVICMCQGVNRNLKVRQLSDEYVQGEIDKLGKFTPGEIKFIITLVLMLIGFLTTSITGLHMYIICMLGVIACTFPGWGFLNAKKAFLNTDWEMILVTVATQLQGVVAAKTGFGQWLVNLLLGRVSSLPTIVFAFAVAFSFALIGFLTTSLPYAMIIPGLIVLGASSGFDPMVTVMVTAMVTGFGYHIPWYAGTRLTAGPNYWTMGDFLKTGWVSFVPFGIILAAVCTILVPLVF